MLGLNVVGLSSTLFPRVESLGSLTIGAGNQLQGV